MQTQKESLPLEASAYAQGFTNTFEAGVSLSPLGLGHDEHVEMAFVLWRLFNNDFAGVDQL